MSQHVALLNITRQELTPWYSQELLETTTVISGSFFGWLFGRFGQAAVTLDGAVHLTPLAPDLASREGTALIGHELVHVLQQQQMGWWSFLARYATAWRPEHVREGWRHPMEAPAYARQTEILAKVLR